ncbi:hypothetical protein HAZT_HAZT000876 [Hyalella azteca]|uniref:Uncharacterized protein n=1 Tax=Hyalella azteca TaxID=294128 RepID=A0A6A0HDA8_HYAAZ|nr:hypothetical protein HAZT_HAZT000876 [Hyalella azteca]
MRSTSRHSFGVTQSSRGVPVILELGLQVPLILELGLQVPVILQLGLQVPVILQLGLQVPVILELGLLELEILILGIKALNRILLCFFTGIQALGDLPLLTLLIKRAFTVLQVTVLRYQLVLSLKGMLDDRDSSEDSASGIRREPKDHSSRIKSSVRPMTKNVASGASSRDAPDTSNSNRREQGYRVTVNPVRVETPDVGVPPTTQKKIAKNEIEYKRDEMKRTFSSRAHSKKPGLAVVSNSGAGLAGVSEILELSLQLSVILELGLQVPVILELGLQEQIILELGLQMSVIMELGLQVSVIMELGLQVSVIMELGLQIH